MAIRGVDVTVDLSPGQVWWARPDPSVGREQAARRPVMIVAGSDYLELMTTLALVVPLTTTDRGWPNHVPIQGQVDLSGQSFAMSEQVRVVSRDRLDRLAGTVTPSCLDQAREWIHHYLMDRAPRAVD